MSPELAIDIHRALDSAVADVGEAQQLRRRAATDADLRRAVREVANQTSKPTEVDAVDAARRATALFILARDHEVGAFAERSEAHRVLFLWGLSEIYRDRPLRALDALRACVEREPRDEQARLQLGSVEALLGEPEKARETLGVLADQTDRAQVLFVLGAIAEAEGEYAVARERYESAMAQDPDNVDSLFRLAYQHDLSGDDDAAIALYERARRVKPTRANILLNLGVLYEDRGDYQKAADCYRQVLGQFPNHPRARPFLRDSESSQSMVMDVDMNRKEDRRNQLLRTPISDFELSVRSRNCLAKMNIQTLGDLIQRTEAELLSYKNFGETSLQEISDILSAKGLRLGMRREDVVVGAEPITAAASMPTLPEVPTDGPERAAILATPLTELDLSVRSSKCMSLLDLVSVGDLLQYTEAELLRAKNFGVTSMQEIKTKLENLGISLTKE